MLLIASLGEGVSQIRRPLDSADARSCLHVCRALGADISETLATDKNGVKFIKEWRVKGIGGAANIKEQSVPLDVGNSGTTLFLGIAIASLASRRITFTGDEQIAKRSAANLLDALKNLGVNVESKNGCTPICVRGPWKGGSVSIECPTSQYLSALLLAAPLADENCVTEIDVPLLNEKPYIEMTLSYLDKLNIKYSVSSGFSHFSIPGGQRYEPLNGAVASDFSSAAFPALAVVCGGGEAVLRGLDPNDTQGDKLFFHYIAEMGAGVSWTQDGNVTVHRDKSQALIPITADLNDTPDMLPALAVAAAFANGESRLVNVAHARLKETDRIAVMTEELTKLGVKIEEKPDGMIIHGAGGRLAAGLACGRARLRGHNDHRIVMALACAGLGAATPLEIEGAEAADVTYPGFLNLLK
jgi:3-phosphoshikimate 1-carboxyvinyltransferase